MAIRIPILTSFDPKGLKQANAAFANLQTSIGSLGRNFAVLGAAAVGVGAFLGKSVGAASDLAESTNAVNVAFGKSAAGILAFGETAATSLGTSQVEFNNAAVRFSAFADRIVGSGNDASKFIADISVRASDFASVFNIEVAEALGVFQSGLAGEAEPLKRFGINLLDSEVKAYAAANGIGELGRQLTETEKVQARYGLLMESTAKTAGDFANTSDGLANSMRIMKAEIADTQARIGAELLPVLEAVIPVVREMISEFGDKLLVAVKAVDWQSLIRSVVDFTVFLVANIETIGKTIGIIFALNTAFKLLAVASGIVKVAIALQTWLTAQLATGMTLATIATNLFSAALRLIPFAILATGFVIGANAARNLTTELEANKIAADSLNPELNNLAYEAEYMGGKFGYVAGAFSNAGREARKLRDELILLQNETGISNSLSPNQSANRARRAAMAEANRRRAALEQSLKSMPDFNSLMSSAASGSSQFIPTFDTSALDQQQAALSQALTTANNEQSEAVKNELEILDKRKSAYESFTDAVKSLFGQIKDSILSSFNLPTLGNSVNSITRNISKLLERTKGFARSISQLSGLGLNSALLQQVIQAGPMAGSQLAAALVSGGGSFISQINRAYGEFGDLAGGIAGTGTTAAFGSQQTINNYSIEVTGGLATGSDVGRAVVNAIRDFERQSGAAWRS
jgi:hypothetical protein